MAAPKDAEKFAKETVIKWSRKDFAKQFESRFSNAEEIYDYFKPKKAKKVEDKED